MKIIKVTELEQAPFDWAAMDNGVYLVGGMFYIKTPIYNTAPLSFFLNDEERDLILQNQTSNLISTTETKLTIPEILSMIEAIKK